MQPFASFLHADHWLHSIVLSLIPELPPTAKTASTLAVLFPNANILHIPDPEDRDKFRHILEEWEHVAVMDNRQLSSDSYSVDTGACTSPTGTPQSQTLSDLYYRKCHDHNQHLRKKVRAFGVCNEAVFVSSEFNKLLIGSRPFESCSNFLVCLDTFWSISFGSCVESDSDRLPLIAAFMHKVRQMKLKPVQPKLATEPKLARSISSLCSPWTECPEMEMRDTVDDTSCHPQKSCQKKLRLFRSHSVSESDFIVGRKSRAGWKSPRGLRRMLSQPARISQLPVFKTGLGMRNSAKLHSTNTSVDHSFTTLQSGADFSLATRASGSSCTSVSASNHYVNPAPSDLFFESVLPKAVVERLKFDGQLAKTERLAEWLNSSAAWHHAVDADARSSAIRIKVSPQLLAYSLWLIESCQHFTPPHVNDAVVAVVNGQVPASVPREPSHSQALVNSGSAGVQSTSVQRSRSHSARTVSSFSDQQPPEQSVEKRGRKGCKKPKAKPVYCSEIRDNVNLQSWLMESPAASLDHELSKMVNRSANNNGDRSGLVVSLNLSLLSSL